MYRGLNLTTGATVAVKRVALSGIPKEELEGIEMEIMLLRNLDHVNIVRYVDAIRTDDHLNIVLEYVENGSLSHLLGKLLRTGRQIEEQLVAVYAAQILEGLHYLHEQGVIHRDIKGANILTTKDGTVKLADFGVATKLNESRKSDSVVGTPYWMAPEIIEMTGQQSSACDIWSVGCTVVELLTGKPPYFELQQMPALFRIVQDEHPPLPDNISPALEDFLMQCFQKDPLRRINAIGLLKHQWLRQAQISRAEEIKLHTQAEVQRKKSVHAGQLAPVLNDPSVARLRAPSRKLSTLPIDELDEEDDPFAHMDDEDEDVAFDPHAPLNTNIINKPLSQRIGSRESIIQTNPSGPQNLIGNAKIKDAWVEDGSDSELDLEDDDLNLAVIARKKNEVWDDRADAGPGGDDGEDVFADLEFDPPDPKADLDAKITKVFMRVIANLNPREEEATILNACKKLTEMISTHPEQIRTLMANHGVIPIMEMLEVANHNVLHSVLSIVNQVIGQDSKFQQSMSLVGLIPAIVRFSSTSFPISIRLEAANFVRHFCYASDFTRKMFIACGGLPILVGFMMEPYASNRTLVFNAIDCTRHVFDISTNPKNDFCRLFCKYGLLAPLARTLKDINADKESPDAVEYTKKVCVIIHLFSQGDSKVKQYFAKPAVMRVLLQILPDLPHEPLTLILKSIRNITMDSSTLDLLENAGAIPALAPHLSSSHHDIQIQVLMSMYYLSTIKASRQEQAARCGVIPHLQRFILKNHPLKQFALPIMFQLAKTSDDTRLELKKYNGVSFFLDLLEESYWRTHALESLALWLSEDPCRVEFFLTSSVNINKIIRVVTATKKKLQFEKILVPLEKILQQSQSVNKALGRRSVFIRELTKRLQLHADSNVIRINLLKILTLIYDHHDHPEKFISQHNLVPVLENLSQDKNAVMVAPLARSLLQQIRN